MRFRDKTKSYIERKFLVHDENNKLLYESDNAKDVAKKFRTNAALIYESAREDKYVLNNKYEKRKLIFSYKRRVVTDEIPFVIPEELTRDIVDLPGEVWATIPGVPDCNKCSNKGRFKVVDTMGNETFNTIVNSVNANGRRYIDVTLINPSGKAIRVRAQRALVKTFIDQSFPLFYEKGSNLVVDHIDNDSTNNDVSNLRVSNYSENVRAALYNFGKDVSKKKKRIMCVEKKKIFPSAAEAARWCKTSSIEEVANAANPNQRRHTACGYHWEYI